MAEKINRNYKSSVFIDLFYEDETALGNDRALVNALFEEPISDDVEIKRVRVDDVLYKNFKNDISFSVGEKLLIFGEHQSTINENMALRCLMYVSRAYESLIPIKARYKEAITKLPTPEFYVFYNGEKPLEKEKYLRLSQSFMVNEKSPKLELIVKVININTSKSHEILEKCRIMKEYSLFVECVRKHNLSGEADSLEKAIKECIAKDILGDYLKRKGSEVVNMLIAEYDYEMDIQVKQEEAFERGIHAKQMEVAKKLFALHDDRQIAEIIGLPLEQVASLRKESE